VGLLEDTHGAEPDLVGNEQPELADERGGELGLADVGTADIQAELLGLQPAAVEERHLGVEFGAVVSHA
jgi:hypothetical protein